MAHPRKLLRQAVVAQLVAASTAAGARVEATREIPRRRATEPAIGVYTPEEENESTGRSAPRESMRSTQLIIEGIVVGSSGVDDALDDLAEQIEDALDADDTFGGKASESSYVRTELETLEDGARTVGLVRLTYNAVYFKLAPAAVAAEDAFEVASLKYDLNGAVIASEQAEDLIEPEQ